MSFFRILHCGFTRQTAIPNAHQSNSKRNTNTFKCSAPPHDTIRIPLELVLSKQSNKFLGFTLEERQRLGIHGLMPACIRSDEEQMLAVESNFLAFSDNVAKYRYMRALRLAYEKLYFKFVARNVKLVLPIIYTPTVGLACTVYGMLYRGVVGIHITKYDRGHMKQILLNWPTRSSTQAICVTDGERILGLGDLGANGMGISVGKMDLYTALAGIPPSKLMPVCLDVGTNNKSLHEDPLYIGLREERLKGDEYVSFVDEFMEAVVDTFGSQTLIHFEDFATPNAFMFLNRYRDCYCHFNDDIQGTAAVGLGGLLGIQRITKKPLEEHVILFAGAGSAAMGITSLLKEELLARGRSEAEAAKNIYFFDQGGAITKNRKNIPENIVIFAKEMSPIKTLEELVEKIKPSILIGATGTRGIFTEKIIRSMAANHDRPGIFAYSNPTSKSECTAEQAYKFSDGRAIFSSGSPFPPVEFNGKRLTPGQANNCFAFPGLVLGTMTVQAERMPSEIFLLAAHELAKFPTDEDINGGRIFPQVEQAIEVALKIGVAVAKYLIENDLAKRALDPDEVHDYILRHAYQLEYGSALAKTWNYPKMKPHPSTVGLQKELEKKK
ncbi:NADP-dependent malic enzyme isoform X1 [Drosophila elegans]|uniref:NADP-dependent malic enzyme isoform X1 n=1 Tax=Drosophila elegans TaxID=30023 RepID=UPI001BC866F3|nr:NADP-dependent malic enzyme isoform X1 [Drosophila elegans]